MKGLSIKIVSIAVLFSMAVCLVACNKLPSGPVTGSDPLGGSTAPVSTEGTASGTDAATDRSSDRESASAPATENRDSDTGNSAGSASDADAPQQSSGTDRTTDTNTKNTQSSSTKTSTSSTSSKTSFLPSDNTDTSNPGTEPEDLPEQPTYNTDITPIPPDLYYGRKWLSSQPNGEKLIRTYNELAAGVEAMKESIPLTAEITVDQLFTVWECYRADYPQHFWIEVGYQYFYRGEIATSVAPRYRMTLAEKEAAQIRFHAAVNSMLTGISSSMSQYEIEKTLHDRLILHCRYSESDNAHNAYGALVEGVAVCEGIAKAFQYLCRAAGIPALFVQGSSINPDTGNPESHAWNVVNVDGAYYHVDVTWDNSGEPTEGRIHYAWFNVTTEQILEDHAIQQRGHTVPTCTATDANYFKKNDLVLPTLTVENILNRTVKQGDEFYFQAYVTDGALDAKTWIKQNARTVANHYGLNGYSYHLNTTGKEISLIMTNYKG